MKLRGLRALALVLTLSCSPALAQVTPGTTPLSGQKGGTGNAFMQFTGPAGSLKSYAVPNVNGTLAMLSQIETWTGAQSFTDGTLVLLGSSSGSSTLKAPATGGGVATLFPGADTVMGLASTQSPTNKTIAGSTNVLGGVTMTLGSDATGDIYYRNSGGILTRLGIGSPGNLLAVSGGLPAWTPPTGGGNVSNTGTPTANQIAQWTNATTVQGVNLASLLTGAGLVTMTGTTTPTITVTAAAKSDEQTGTSATLATTPSQQQQHDSAGKAWVYFSGTTINASYNVSGVTNPTTGNYVISFTVPFASGNYSCVCTATEGAAGNVCNGVSPATRLAGSIQIAGLTLGGSAGNTTAMDLQCHGRQ